LNINQSSFEVGHTFKVRTKETAEAFARALIELQMRNDDSTFDEDNDRVEGKAYYFKVRIN